MSKHFPKGVVEDFQDGFEEKNILLVYDIILRP